MEMQEDVAHPDAARYRDRLPSAPTRTMDERLREGQKCSDLSCRLMADGVRHRFKLTDRAAIWQKVRKRLDVARRIEECGIY